MLDAQTETDSNVDPIVGEIIILPSNFDQESVNKLYRRFNTLLSDATRFSISATDVDDICGLVLQLLITTANEYQKVTGQPLRILTNRKMSRAIEIFAGESTPYLEIKKQNN